MELVQKDTEVNGIKGHGSLVRARMDPLFTGHSEAGTMLFQSHRQTKNITGKNPDHPLG